MTALRNSIPLRMHRQFALAAAPLLATAVLLVVTAFPVLAQAPGIADVLAPGVVPESVQENFIFTEGPVGTADGGLFFSDIRASKTYYLDLAGKITVARQNTNEANGVALSRDGEHLFAEARKMRISQLNQDG